MAPTEQATTMKSRTASPPPRAVKESEENKGNEDVKKKEPEAVTAKSSSRGVKLFFAFFCVFVLLLARWGAYVKQEWAVQIGVAALSLDSMAFVAFGMLVGGKAEEDVSTENANAEETEKTS